jgi:hypothetical protein
MTYEKVKELSAENFKRLCGVRKETFTQMVQLLEKNVEGKMKTGRPSKLSLENQVLMTLEYLREYRTYFHISQYWGINESTAYRIIRKVEDILVKSAEFRLPGKKELLKSEYELEVVVVDVTETPIERPKKNKRDTIVARKKGTH